MNSRQAIPKSILSIDVEDYYMVSAFESVVKRAGWDGFESRIERNTRHILALLDECQDTPGHGKPHATFFCLGWLAERYPHLIREIHDQGHEIASHGYHHHMITTMSKEEFREDIRRSKALLEDISFDASDVGTGQVKIDKSYVSSKVQDIAQDSDLSKFIL